jgi:hypothetical protein
MRITTVQLRGLMVRLAAFWYGDGAFRRMEFMRRTELELKRVGIWEPQDDLPSKSHLSKGMAWIDGF